MNKLYEIELSTRNLGEDIKKRFVLIAKEHLNQKEMNIEIFLESIIPGTRVPIRQKIEQTTFSKTESGNDYAGPVLSGYYLIDIQTPNPWKDILYLFSIIEDHMFIKEQTVEKMIHWIN